MAAEVTKNAEQLKPDHGWTQIDTDSGSKENPSVLAECRGQGSDVTDPAVLAFLNLLAHLC
jgi:hypothetical protein